MTRSPTSSPTPSSPPAELDLHHCPTCGQGYLECGTPWPPSLADVAIVRCRLPRGHRSEEHWHHSLWQGTPDLLWWDDEAGPDA